MRSDALLPLRAGLDVAYHLFDWGDRTLSESTVELGATSTIVVEGLFVSRPELVAEIDVSVLVVAAPLIRSGRQAARADASDARLNRWDRAGRCFLENVRQEDSYDVVVDSTLAPSQLSDGPQCCNLCLDKLIRVDSVGPTLDTR